MSAPLLESITLSDTNLIKVQSKIEASTAKEAVSWISGEMITHVVLSTAAGGGVYVAHAAIGYPLSLGVFLKVHMMVGAVLGLALVGRIVLGFGRLQAVSASVHGFSKNCRQMAVLATFVSETITVSAGAESEKKAVGQFRYELVRLLNMAFYSFSLMLQAQKMALPPASLKGTEAEAHLLGAVDNSTVMVTKMIAKLVEQQRAAKRISNECTSVVMGKVSDLIDAYHTSLSLTLSPSASTFASLTYSMTVLFAYSAGPVIALTELEENIQSGLSASSVIGLTLTIGYTLLISLFYFGLLEAGKAVDAPLAKLYGLLAVDEMMYVLSDDLASLTEDDSVPVFLPRP